MINLAGQRFGRLVARSHAYSNNGFNYWACECDCGNSKITRQDSLQKGMTKSCGCLVKEQAKKHSTKHGQSGTRLYLIWNGMRQRCENPRDTTFHNYGGRGISVCNEWLNFNSFFMWAIANGYKDDLSIDRKDNNGNYEPGNCRWITLREQQRNKRTNRLITYDGKTMCLKDWENMLGFSRGLIANRLERGWSIKNAINVNAQPHFGGRKPNGIKNL